MKLIYFKLIFLIIAASLPVSIRASRALRIRRDYYGCKDANGAAIVDANVRPHVNEFLFDGVSVLQPEPGQIAFFPVVDAISEFKIEINNPPAEFGCFNGGIINLTTNAGTNDFHGSIFEFFRNEPLNARNLFAPANQSKPCFAAISSEA